MTAAVQERGSPVLWFNDYPYLCPSEPAVDELPERARSVGPKDVAGGSSALDVTSDVERAETWSVPGPRR